MARTRTTTSHPAKSQDGTFTVTVKAETEPSVPRDPDLVRRIVARWIALRIVQARARGAQ